MKAFLQRWLPSLFGEPALHPHTAPVPTAPVAQSRLQSPLAGDDAQSSAQLAAIGARRPLVSPAGTVVGFEFRMDEEVARHLKRQTDAQSRAVRVAARVAALLTSASLIVQTGRIGFVRMPTEWLLQATGVPLGAGILIGLESNPDGPVLPQIAIEIEHAVASLRTKGVQVGWEPGFDAGTRPDFVFLRQGANPMSTLLQSMSAWPIAWAGLPVLVTDICNVEELEMALYNGVSYACGALEGAAESAKPESRQPVPPEVRRIGIMLNQLVSGVDTTVLVDAIKGDVGLSYRLLSRINSAAYAQLGNCASIEQAVLLLGRYELYRWLSVLLVQFTGSRKASSALQEMALWRSRLLELLAMGRGEPSPDQFFTLGLASMLGLILKISQAEVVATLHLPPFARQALLEHAGPWHAYLEVVMLVESHQLDQSTQAIAPFGGAARLLHLSDQAWHWAAQQTAQVTGSGGGKGG